MLSQAGHASSDFRFLKGRHFVVVGHDPKLEFQLFIAGATFGPFVKTDSTVAILDLSDEAKELHSRLAAQGLNVLFGGDAVDAYAATLDGQLWGAMKENMHDKDLPALVGFSGNGYVERGWRTVRTAFRTLSGLSFGVELKDIPRRNDVGRAMVNLTGKVALQDPDFVVVDTVTDSTDSTQYCTYEEFMKTYAISLSLPPVNIATGPTWGRLERKLAPRVRNPPFKPDLSEISAHVSQYMAQSAAKAKIPEFQPQDSEVDSQTLETIHIMLRNLGPDDLDVNRIMQVTAGHRLRKGPWGPSHKIDLYLFHLARLTLLKFEKEMKLTWDMVDDGQQLEDLARLELMDLKRLFTQLKEPFWTGEGYDAIEAITLTNVVLRRLSRDRHCSPGFDTGLANLLYLRSPTSIAILWLLFTPREIFKMMRLYYKGASRDELEPLFKKLADVEARGISSTQDLFMNDGGTYGIVTQHKTLKRTLNIYHGKARNIFERVAGQHLSERYRQHEDKQMYTESRWDKNVLAFALLSEKRDCRYLDELIEANVFTYDTLVTPGPQLRCLHESTFIMGTSQADRYKASAWQMAALWHKAYTRQEGGLNLWRGNEGIRGQNLRGGWEADRDSLDKTRRVETIRQAKHLVGDGVILTPGPTNDFIVCGNILQIPLDILFMQFDTLAVSGPMFFRVVSDGQITVRPLFEITDHGYLALRISDPEGRYFTVAALDKCDPVKDVAVKDFYDVCHAILRDAFLICYDV